MKNEKKLLLLNGRWNFGNGSHIYIAAYSVADACRICNEVVGYESKVSTHGEHILSKNYL